MASENYHTAHARVVKSSDHGDINGWRRACGCIKTSQKLKQILATFPAPLPPAISSPTPVEKPANNLENACISAYCHHPHGYPAPNTLSDTPPLPTSMPAKPSLMPVKEENLNNTQDNVKKAESKLIWRFIAELVSLVQLSVTATALALYYLIYCYMQLVYCTLHSALYFHNADGPMKITIAVVTLTSLVVGFNLVIRLERLIGIIPYAPS